MCVKSSKLLPNEVENIMPSSSAAGATTVGVGVTSVPATESRSKPVSNSSSSSNNNTSSMLPDFALEEAEAFRRDVQGQKDIVANATVSSAQQQLLQKHQQQLQHGGGSSGTSDRMNEEEEDDDDEEYGPVPMVHW